MRGCGRTYGAGEIGSMCHKKVASQRPHSRFVRVSQYGYLSGSSRRRVHLSRLSADHVTLTPVTIPGQLPRFIHYRIPTKFEVVDSPNNPNSSQNGQSSTAIWRRANICYRTLRNNGTKRHAAIRRSHCITRTCRDTTDSRAQTANAKRCVAQGVPQQDGRLCANCTSPPPHAFTSLSFLTDPFPASSDP